MHIEDKLADLEKRFLIIENFIKSGLKNMLIENLKSNSEFIARSLRGFMEQKLKFRFHDALFQDSIKTLVYIKDKQHFTNLMKQHLSEVWPSCDCSMSVDANSIYQAYDNRIGWDDESYLVTIEYPNGKHYPVGYSNFDLNVLNLIPPENE